MCDAAEMHPPLPLLFDDDLALFHLSRCFQDLYSCFFFPLGFFSTRASQYKKMAAAMLNAI